MAEKKYEKYFIREPIEKGKLPALHVCGENGCFGEGMGFPAEVQLFCITEPNTMIPEPHTHDVDELFFIFGSNPKNIAEFDADIDIYVEGEPYKITTATTVFFPKGIAHCPVVINKVNKPFMWMHVLFKGEYQVAEGDITIHPVHATREQYTPEELNTLRSGGTL